ncbi:MAG: neutral amino acid transporter [Sclerophora amabilis]|nr:MAG: neutral amino acid transporter [Sclerophora amabilis]
MSGQRASPSSSSKPRPIPSEDSGQSLGGSSRPGSFSRNSSTARLTSPFPSGGGYGSPHARQTRTPSQFSPGNSQTQTPLPGGQISTSLSGPGRSALSSALQSSFGRSPPRFGTPPTKPPSPGPAGASRGSGPQSTYGSFDRSMQAPGVSFEDADVVRRHLVDENAPAGRRSQIRDGEGSPPSGTGLDDDEFSSLKLQGGDITRQVYRWSEEADAQVRGKGRGQRSQSFHALRPEPESEVLDIHSIKVPGGLRRDYLRRAAENASPSGKGRLVDEEGVSDATRRRPYIFTNNFIEFLSIYGHFAGEELEEDDEVLGPDEYFSSDPSDATLAREDEDDDDREWGEESGLLTPGTPGRRKRRRKERAASGNTPLGAAVLLLKSFVGTGVLFLPKAFLNGGMLFSNIILLFVAALSYHCFVLLVNTRLKLGKSFGDMGGQTYGKYMRFIILFSVVISQIGFAAAYIVFTSENLQAFILAVSKCRTFIDIKYMILMQLIIFMPLSLTRNINKLTTIAYIAEVFIALGLIYLYYYDIFTIAVRNHGLADIVNFNSQDWTLFIGTAIFTFEGIGLIIPIQESMKKPSQFPRVLGIVMLIISILFISAGALSYAAYGSNTKTVVILNLPQDDKFVNGVQFIYSLAILLSTPLQLFPAIRILETEFFTRSGKYNPYIKWQKNLFRFCFVLFTTCIAWGGAGDLDKFVAVVGSFACVPLVYVYPPMLHYKAVARTTSERGRDIALVVFGIVVMFYTTTLTLIGWVNGNDEKTPGYCD